jgi:hypothetical protein
MKCPECGLYIFGEKHTLEECVVAQVHECENISVGPVSRGSVMCMRMTQQEWDDILKWTEEDK